MNVLDMSPDDIAFRLFCADHNLKKPAKAWARLSKREKQEYLGDAVQILSTGKIPDCLLTAA